MTPTIRLGRIFGIEVGLNWSLLFVFALITWSLAAGMLPQEVPGQPEPAYWLAAVAAAALFYACLLAHELAHAITATHLGVRVSGITLWLFGGVSRLGGEPASARGEALIAAVGPLASLAVAALTFALSVALKAFGAPVLATDVLSWLALLNVSLAVFNLLPAFPLDGGRLLASLQWSRLGSRRRGVHSAVRVGRVLAYLMIGLGLLELFTGSLLNGVWIAFLGWFLLSAAAAEETSMDVRAALASVPVAAAMTSPVVSLPDWITVERFLADIVPQHRFTSYPLVDQAGNPSGMVRLRDLLHALPGSAREKPLRSVAIPISEVPSTTPEESLAALMERLGPAIERRVLVFGDGRLVGIVSPVDIMRVLDVRRALERSRNAAGRGGPGP